VSCNWLWVLIDSCKFCQDTSDLEHFGPSEDVWKRASVTNSVIFGLRLGNGVQVRVSIRVRLGLILDLMSPEVS